MLDHILALNALYTQIASARKAALQILLTPYLLNLGNACQFSRWCYEICWNYNDEGTSSKDCTHMIHSQENPDHDWDTYDVKDSSFSDALAAVLRKGVAAFPVLHSLEPDLRNRLVIWLDDDTLGGFTVLRRDDGTYVVYWN